MHNLRAASLSTVVRRRLRYEINQLYWRIIGLVRSRITLSTEQGILSVYTKDQEISRDLFARRQFEWDLSLRMVDWLVSHTSWRQGNGTILDVGANMGVISIGMIHNRLFRSAIAIEPEPRNFALLQENVDRNGLRDAIHCLPFAVGAEAGEVQFELSRINFGDHRVRKSGSTPVRKELFGEGFRSTIDVKMDTIDRLLENHASAEVVDEIALVWIDIQGFEGFAFRGSPTLFARDIPVFTEVWPYGIRRAGMTTEEFCAIVQRTWGNYWVSRRGRFVRYPTVVFPSFIEELGDGDGAENIILSR